MPTKRVSLASGAFPVATFPQNFLAGGINAGAMPTAAKATPLWSPPQPPPSDLVAAMRQAIRSTDWQQLYLDNKTKFLVSGSWSADEQRCGVLQTLCAVSGARKVLELGQCCGVATLAIAEVLPQDGTVTTVEVDPYLADFGKQFWARSPHGSKIHSHVCPAAEYLSSALAKEEGPFDLIIIDADKDGMWGYYSAVKEKGLLADRAAIVLDTTPYKGQPPDRYVKYGATQYWESNSGKEAIEQTLQKLHQEESIKVSSFSGVTVVYPQMNK